MIIFILIAIFAVLGVALGVLAYSSNNRKRAAQKDIPAVGTERPAEHRASGND
jgi:hypothetical protein